MAKKGLVFVSILTMIVSLVFTSCKKYEHGPGFTVLTKKNRLTGNWVFETGFVNEKEQKEGLRNFFGEDYMWQIKNDGTYTESGNFNDAGVWDLIDSKSKIEFKSFSDSIPNYSVKILRLTKDEFWYEQVAGSGQVFKIHLRQ